MFIDFYYGKDIARFIILLCLVNNLPVGNSFGTDRDYKRPIAGWATGESLLEFLSSRFTSHGYIGRSCGTR